MKPTLNDIEQAYRELENTPEERITHVEASVPLLVAEVKRLQQVLQNIIHLDVISESTGETAIQLAREALEQSI